MSSSASTASATTSAAASSSSAASGSISVGSNLKIVGIILAIASGCLIGTSFVFKKKGLLRAQAGKAAGEGVGYLKSPLWWIGMTMMILGELCNFAAYAFIEAIVVTPLGALSVVICAILSSIFLQEKLTFFGWLGCGLCIIGSVIIALNGPSESTVGQIKDFQKLFLAPGFLSYASVLIATALAIIFYFAPRYGKKSMLWYIFVCSMIGGISVSVTTGLGAAIVTTAEGDNQFKYWFIYFLLGFVAVTLITEVYYLNVALALFNTAMVTPTYYVIFTFFSILTTIVLFQGLSASATSIITLVMGFIVICFGITILQMSKVDPENLTKLDRRSTILLQASREHTAGFDEKDVLAVENPGIDTLRGSFGTVGSIIRARSARRMSQSRGNRPGSYSTRPAGAMAPYDPPHDQSWLSPRNSTNTDYLGGLKRHQLFDAPVPPGSPSLTGATRGDDVSSISSAGGNSQMMNKRPTIKFDTQDVVHQYHPTGQTPGGTRGDPTAIHGHRATATSPGPPGTPGARADSYPPSLSMSTTAAAATGAGAGPGASRDLLSESPTETEGPSASALSQIISLPPLPPRSPGQESIPYSAPPTSILPHSRQGRKDSRDIFNDTPSTTTLMSFPSVTDSARSWDADEEPNYSGHLGARGRRYPKGNKDTDREESVSLWQRDSMDSASGEGDDDDGATQHGGIRLVTSPYKGEGSRF
ncbi:magnesium transporter NIPA-domain-containing protein [Lentinula aff. detonsa]|uniref:Magnesium transporter NIPA-domain-containing protein n=1 Tax=Lentinula aff. detonsa TaxID=2804958 RepID=A0AA38NKL4_9AGAR|nr:magnesium transporter NIPA-domain-containing protein [Lentinula aff. detonsa]